MVIMELIGRATIDTNSSLYLHPSPIVLNPSPIIACRNCVGELDPGIRLHLLPRDVFVDLAIELILSDA
ncbi:hypothetical protein Bpfe_029715 [Biomphalaria pfeifferi]|uniref:Uncharacterized protein n=1 Tax=Biomphalaria pfeifferi TaxID=112525 RepID=A0AAD8AR33_BIOPF|nr:hypothetical protein Bpfe_029715 [Biomphalaria pfeifferi]